MNRHGLLFLRFGLGGVFFWFGVDKFIHTSVWSAWIPEWFIGISPLSLIMVTYLIGVVEILVGAFVLAGLFTRFAAGFAALMLAGIIFTVVGFNEIGVRDAGLFFLALGLAFLGGGCISLDHEWKCPE